MSDDAKANWTPEDTRVAIEHGKVIGGAFWEWCKRRWRGKPRSPDQTTPTSSEAEKGILVIGPGGTGKSTFAKLISGQLLPWVFGDTWKYDESLSEETFVLQDQPGVEIVVPAGQHYRRDASWASVRGDLVAGRYAGVVLTAANGYHSFGGLGYRSHPLFQGKRDDFLRDYVEAKRQDELATLDFLLPALESAPDKLWLMTLVTKEDLWTSSPKNEKDAHQFYTAGKWAEAVAKVQATRGGKSFRPEFCPVSITMCNLKDPDGTVLFPTTSGYDVERQGVSVQKLFKALDALRQWEGES